METLHHRKMSIVLFSIIALLENVCTSDRRQANVTDIIPCNGTFGATNCTKIDDSGTALTTDGHQPTIIPPFPTWEDPHVNLTSFPSVTESFDTPPLFANDTDDQFGIPPPFPQILPFDQPTTDSWVDSDYDWTVIDSTEVDVFIESQDAREYIASFTDVFQRMLIEETLRICPYIVLCNFTFGLVPPPSFIRVFVGDPCCSPCSCQSDCVSEGTCCPDYRSLPLVHMAQSPSIEVTETCMPMFIRQHPMTMTKLDNVVKAYQDCPPNADINLHFRCAGSFASFSSITLVDVIPLTDNDTMKTYRNQHCAICNGVDIIKLIPWTPRMDCWVAPSFKSETELLSGIINGFQPCVINLWAPDTDLDYCDQVITSCNETGSWVEYDPVVHRACGVYETIVGVTRDYDTRYFKNPYCAICNGMSPSEYICPANRGDLSPIPYSFSGLLRLGSSKVKDDSDASLSSCGPDGLFDDVKKRCRNVTCAFHQTFKDRSCEVFFSSSGSVGYRVFTVVRPSMAISVKDVYDIMPAIKEKYEKMVQEFGDGSICTSQTIIVSAISSAVRETDMLVDHIEFLYDVVPFSDVPIDTTVESLFSLDGSNITVEHNVLGTIVFNVYLKDDRSEYNTRIAYARFDNWTLAGDPIPLRGMFEESFVDNDKLFIPYIEWSQHHETCFFQGVFHRLLTMRSCPMFAVNMTEFGLIETPFGLQLETRKDSIINLSDYVIDDNYPLIRMCVDTYSRIFKTAATKVLDVYSTELIVSIIAVSVSIICLTISLFSYCLLPQLQTLPGKNNMALIVSLLLAQGTYLLSSFGSFDTGSFSCKLVGGLTHFFWLLAIFWMNICTFHMFRVLVRTRNVSSMARSKKYILYHVYSIIMSGIFMAINVIVSMVTSGYSDYGYGNTRCYVSTQRMLEITLGIPAVIVVVANLSMFVAIIVKLKRAPTVNKNVKHERNYLLVFAKLSTITGATWLFGFVYMWTGILAFSYIFTILNGSQGLFLMLSFVCNGRTVVMLKDRSSSLKFSISGTQASNVHSVKGDVSCNSGHTG